MRYTLFGLIALLVLGAIPTASPRAQELAAEELVERARFTVHKVAREQELSRTVPSLLARAKGVMIFPQLLKGAFIIGGEGGSGVLLTRAADGSWSNPAFYTMGTISFGLQIGGQASEAVLVIMTDRGLAAILEDQVKLGADLSAAAGPLGVGAAAATTTALGADIYTYSTAQGLFIGGSLEGAVIARREDYNKAFYGPEATVRGIVVERRFGNHKADALRQSLAELAAPR